MTKRFRLVAVGVGAALALGGCGSSGSGGESSKGHSASASVSSTRRSPDASITHAEAASITRAYEKQNNIAISKALNKPYDAKAWQTVDSGPILAADAYDTRAASLKKSKQPTSAGPEKAPRVLSAFGSPTHSSDGREPWTLVIAHRDGSKAPDASVAGAFVYVKGPTGWRMDAQMGGVTLKTLPHEVQTTPSLTAAQRQAAANAVPVVVDAVATGTMSHVANPAPLKAFRTAVRADGSKGYLVGADCRPWGTKEGTDVATATVVGTDALRLTRVGAQTLAVLNLDCRLDTYSQDGGQVQIPRDVARVEGDDGKAKDSVVRRASLMVLMSIPDKGKPKIIGSDGTYLIPTKH
ncbi:MAG TPA: hypothetical protein VG502_01340 [Flexivirga sp.]|uniref:hypothetical protein n=1 Tax=Flexivirga sp. TaxID=1962927 RepID=UPI002C9743BA|nr:hypothetical protein [Flexivirga sp.]HWC20918.1 hypothetical protein [Flexivirga sp.]